MLRFILNRPFNKRIHYMSLVRCFYPKRLTYCGQSPQEQFGVKCLAQGHNDMLTAVCSPDPNTNALTHCATRLPYRYTPVGSGLIAQQIYIEH